VKIKFSWIELNEISWIELELNLIELECPLQQALCFSKYPMNTGREKMHHKMLSNYTRKVGAYSLHFFELIMLQLFDE